MGNSQSTRRRSTRGHDAPVVVPQGQRAPYTPQQIQATLMMGRFSGGDQESGPPPPDVQQTYTLHNVVHLKKKTLELVPVESSSGKFLLRFEVDLLAPCAVTVFLDCKEYTNPSTQAVEYSATWKSAPLRLDQGMGQVVGGEDAPAHREHCLLDLSAVSGEHLSHAPGSYRFPLIIELREEHRAEGGGEADPVAEHQPAASAAARVQKTYATLDVSSPETPTATVLKQQIEVDGKMYEVQEIYGIEQNAAAAAGDESVLCVVCLTNPVNTMCLPCRHMCMCEECANALRLQSNRCPVCRTQITTFLQVEVDRSAQAGTGASASAAPTPGGERAVPVQG